MKWSARIILGQNTLPQDYRRKFLSLAKHALEQYGDNELLLRYFQNPRPKKYCQSLYVPGRRFVDKEVVLGEPYVVLTVSSTDYQVLWEMYNAFNSLIGKKYVCSGIEMQVERLFMVADTPITEEEVSVRLIEPIVLRDHDRATNRDVYVTVDDADFADKLIKGVRDRLDALGEDKLLGCAFNVVDTSGAKRTVVKHYGSYIPVTVGVITIGGDRELLEFIRQNGIGSFSSAFFGVFEVIGGR